MFCSGDGIYPTCAGSCRGPGRDVAIFFLPPRPFAHNSGTTSRHSRILGPE